MKIRQQYILTIISFFLLFGCTKDEVEGPLINDIYGDFYINQPFLVINKTPDFSIDELVKFQCEFNKNINWKISITGMATGSHKIISGFSNSVDSNVSIWNGNTSQYPFFKKEYCSIELTFLDEPDTLRDTIEIMGSKLYNDGFIIADFENGLPLESILYINPNNFVNDTFVVASDLPLLGNNYFKARGRVNWEWNIGKLDFKLDYNSTISAENLYINIGVLSDTVNLHTGQFINILISESDLPYNDDLSNNGADIFETSMEVYKMKIPVDWNGWQILSFRYSDFEELLPNALGVTFNKNPNNISGMRIAFQSCPSSGPDENCPENFDKPIRIDIDHVVLTENKSLLDQ